MFAVRTELLVGWFLVYGIQILGNKCLLLEQCFGWFLVYGIQILGNKCLLLEQNCLLVGFLFMAFRF